MLCELGQQYPKEYTVVLAPVEIQVQVDLK